MKRFYKEVSVAGGRVLLDGRPVRTPGKAVLELPGAALAEAIAAEWRDQGETLSVRTMPLTGIANAAIDRVPTAAAFAANLAKYGETDLLCYRADAPRALIERQASAWDPLLDWARGRYDIHFTIATGIMHRAQPAATVARLADAVAAHDPFALAGLSQLVTISGSLVAALAVAEGQIDAEDAFAVTHLDELWQAERWGEDALATAARAARRADFLAAARFVDLL